MRLECSDMTFQKLLHLLFFRLISVRESYRSILSCFSEKDLKDKNHFRTPLKHVDRLL